MEILRIKLEEKLLINHYLIKHLILLKIHYGYQRGLASIVYKYFDKKTSSGGIKNEKTSNKELAEELRKPILRKFNKQKVHSSFISNFWGADLADIQLLNKLNKGVRFSW